jgi:threonyl-tRNA synthetase
MLIVGEKEAADGTVSVREQGKGDLGSMSPGEFSALIKARIKDQIGSVDRIGTKNV